MIRIECPGCGSKLSAKDELAGQTRKCPKCDTAVLIPAGPPEAAAEPAATLVEPAPDQHVQPPGEKALEAFPIPERLDRQNHYLIVDKAHLVAAWENNGHGWMLNTNFGFVSAVRNHEQLPAQGDFKLVELKLAMTDAGLRLAGLTAYQLAPRWALTTLDKGDDLIVAKITGPGFLNRDQKSVVRKAIKDQFMRRVWEHAEGVLDYLGSTDYHSPGIG